MKILVFGGSGKIGTAVAWDLAQDARVQQIGLVGRSPEALEKARRLVGAASVVLHALDVSDAQAVRDAMKGTTRAHWRSRIDGPATGSSRPRSRPGCRSSTCWRSTTARRTSTRPRGWRSRRG